ncbi:MAG: hypothetical protein JSV65_12070 [Armatimonadota bacterium]|nr:MAG: hypothetical protein JSV65_12070 [Armatimonadota bacterium]
MIFRIGFAVLLTAGCLIAAGATAAGEEVETSASGGGCDAPAVTPAPLTLADPELREIVSHFKHPDEAPQHWSPPVAVAVREPAGYAVHAFASVKPYWPPVIVGRPPRPVMPFFWPIVTPGTPPFLSPLSADSFSPVP